MAPGRGEALPPRRLLPLPMSRRAKEKRQVAASLAAAAHASTVLDSYLAYVFKFGSAD